MAWYLANRPEVGRYLAERRLDAEKLRAEIEASVGRPPVVERLSAMQAERRGV